MSEVNTLHESIKADALAMLQLLSSSVNSNDSETLEAIENARSSLQSSTPANIGVTLGRINQLAQSVLEENSKRNNNNHILFDRAVDKQQRRKIREYMESSSTWIEEHTNERFLHDNLIYDLENNPDGIYDPQSRAIRRELVGEGKRYEARTEIVDGIPQTRYFDRASGLEIPGTYEQAVSQIEAHEANARDAIASGDTNAVFAAQAQIARRLASMQVVVTPPPPTPETEQAIEDVRHVLQQRGEPVTEENIRRVLSNVAARYEENEFFHSMNGRIAQDALAQMDMQDSITRIQLDANSNGAIDQTDITALASRVDTDGDGRITNEELARLQNIDGIADAFRQFQQTGVAQEGEDDRTYVLGQLNAAIAPNLAQGGEASRSA